LPPRGVRPRSGIAAHGTGGGVISDGLPKMIAALPGPIVVLGAGGFIGANLLHQLLAVRSDAYGTIRLGKGWRLADIEESRLVALDLLDADAAARSLDRLRPRTI